MPLTSAVRGHRPPLPDLCDNRPGLESIAAGELKSLESKGNGRKSEGSRLAATSIALSGESLAAALRAESWCGWASFTPARSTSCSEDQKNCRGGIFFPRRAPSKCGSPAGNRSCITPMPWPSACFRRSRGRRRKLELRARIFESDDVESESRASPSDSAGFDSAFCRADSERPVRDQRGQLGRAAPSTRLPEGDREGSSQGNAGGGDGASERMGREASRCSIRCADRERYPSRRH